MKARNLLYMSLAVLALAIAWAIVFQSAGSPAVAAQSPERDIAAPLAEQLQQEFAAVAAKVNNTVVNIDVERPYQEPAYQYWQFGPEFQLPPEFRQFFDFPFPGQQQPRGGQMPRQAPSRPPMRAAGSGVIIDAENGYIVTNSHVVRDVERIGVTTFSGRTYEAELVGIDPSTDLAVVKIDADDEDLQEIELGDMEDLEVGHIVFAFGQPEGLKYTVTQGIVSALGRAGLGIITEPTGFAGYEDFIQTDAAVNPGNSGGPLTDIHGRLVGINTAIATAGVPQFGGISFAIPVSIVKRVVPQLIERGEVVRGYIGVQIADLENMDEVEPPVNIEQYDVGGQGVYIAGVEPGTPAAEAGLQEGDVVVGFGGEPVSNTFELRNRVAETPIGTETSIEVVRMVAGRPERTTLEVTVARQPQTLIAGGVTTTDFGVTVQTLTDDLARALGLEEGETGVVVTEVARGSRAAQAGIQPGDVITQIRFRGETVDIASGADLTQVLNRVPEDQPFAVRIKRQGRSEFVPVR